MPTTSVSSSSSTKKGRKTPTKRREGDYALQVASPQLNTLLPTVKSNLSDSAEIGSQDLGMEESYVADQLEPNVDSPDSIKSSSTSSNHMDAESLSSTCASVEQLQREECMSWGQAGRSGSNSSADSLRQSEPVLTMDSQSLYRPINEDVADDIIKAGHIYKKKIPRKHPAPPKICDNCGTQAVLHKAKKCHNCGKFFFQHWARRCRIPPCPRCHYSRRSGGIKRLPTHCEKCNYPLFDDPAYSASAEDFQILPGTPDLATSTSTDKGGVTAIVLSRQSPERNKHPNSVPFSPPAEAGYSSSALSFPSVGYGPQLGASSSTASHLLPSTSQTNAHKSRLNPLFGRDSTKQTVNTMPSQFTANQASSSSVVQPLSRSVGSDEAKTRLKQILGIAPSPPRSSTPPPKKSLFTDPITEVGSVSDKPISTVIACPVPDIPNPSVHIPSQFKLSIAAPVPNTVTTPVSTPMGTFSSSSPLLEYAHRISARVMIPEEIKGQEKKTQRGKYSRYRKKSVGPSKQQPGKRKESPVPESQQMLGEASSTGSPPTSPRILGSPSLTAKNTQPLQSSHVSIKTEASSPLAVGPLSSPSLPSQHSGVLSTITTSSVLSLPPWPTCTSAPLKSSSFPPLLSQLSSEPLVPSPSVVTLAPPERPSPFDPKSISLPHTYQPIRPRPSNISLPNISHSYGNILGSVGVDQQQKYHSTTSVVGSDGRAQRIPVHASLLPPPLVSQALLPSTSKTATVLQPQSKYTIHDGKIISQENLQAVVSSPSSYPQQCFPHSTADLGGKTSVSVPPLVQIAGSDKATASNLSDYWAPTEKGCHQKQQVTVRKLPIPSQQVAHTTVIVDPTNVKSKLPLVQQQTSSSLADQVSEKKTENHVRGVSLTILPPTSSSVSYHKEDEAMKQTPQSAAELGESDVAEKCNDDEVSETGTSQSQGAAVSLEVDVNAANTEEARSTSNKQLPEEKSVLKKKKKKDKKKKKKRHHKESSGANKDGGSSRSHHRSHERSKDKRKALKASLSSRRSKTHSPSKKDHEGVKEQKSGSKKYSKSSKRKDGGDKKSGMNSDKEMENAIESMEEGLQETKEENPKTEAGPEDDSAIDQPSLYTVRIKDCAIHQFVWGNYRMTLLDPRSGNPTTPSRDSATTTLNSTQGSVTSSGGSIGKERMEDDEEGEKETLPLGHGRLLRSRGRRKDSLDERRDHREKDAFKSKKKTRKSDVLEEMENDEMNSSQSMEFVDDVDGDMSSTPNHNDIIPPSFTIYELRNKVFSTCPPRAVHAFTYKFRIKTYRPHLHWIHILKIFGGLPETCHMCRLLDVESVKLLCNMHQVDIPPVLDQLLNGFFSPEREVIDISQEDPTTLITNPSLLHDNIPNCPFFDKSPKKKSISRKRSHCKLLPKQDCSEQEEQDEAIEDSSEEEVGGESAAKKQKLDVAAAMEELEQDQVQVKEEQLEQEMDEGDEEEEEEEDDEDEENEELAKDRCGRPRLLAMSHSSLGIFQPSSSQKSLIARKKPCPSCGSSVARKSKKCHHCGKSFGVFTFGRRLCTRCSHINLARMHACFKCGLSLEKAPTAIPKDVEAPEAQASNVDEPDLSAVKLDFRFGMRKRRKVQAISSPNIKSHQNSCITTNSPEEQSGDASRQSSPYTADDGDGVEEVKTNNSGYQYSKIPWNDADLALVISDDRTPKFCLQEMCSKVLRYLTKVDVFEVVKSLHLPIKQGDTTLLKKLQALGLHPNRSPICKLIAAEDLFALMDALQEPVPGEVHQHLEAINARTHESSPQESPGSQSATAASTSVMPSVSLIEEDKEHSFESTLHEVMCSDGQSLSLIRAWNGDQLLCLLEVWRRYFPEVNRSHLSCVLKRLEVDTQVPTSQQTSLLRVAGIISVRGAPGRLVKLSDARRLLDDLSIPLQIGSYKPENKSPDGQASDKFVSAKSPVVELAKQGVIEERDEAGPMVKCMKTLLDLVEPDVMMEMIQKTADSCAEQLKDAEEEIKELSTEINKIHNHILFNRELCKTFLDEVAFLTVTNHTQMAELVRLSRMSRQALHELDPLIDITKLQFLPVS